MARRRPQSGFTVLVTWFEPARGGTPRVPVADGPALRQLLAPYRDHDRLAVYLDRDEGEGGSVWVHLAGDRAWVTHFTRIGGIDSYARTEAERGGGLVGFLLDNGQEDPVHRYWTVPRAAGLRALEYFLERGDRDPALSWVAEPRSLQEPAWPADP